MPFKTRKVLVTKYTDAGYEYQALEKIYDYAQVMQWNYGKVGGAHVISDGFDGQFFQGWRNRLRSGRDITGRYIPTDDRCYIIKIHTVIRPNDKIIIVDTSFGKCSISQKITWDNAKMGVLGGFGKQKSFDWIHDDNKKKCFAWTFLKTDDIHHSFFIAYGRVIPTKYFDQIVRILMNDPVVKEEYSTNARLFYKNKGYDIEKIVNENIDHYEEAKKISAERKTIKRKDKKTGKETTYTESPSLEWHKFRHALLKNIANDIVEKETPPNNQGNLPIPLNGGQKQIGGGVIFELISQNPELKTLLKKELEITQTGTNNG